MARHPTGEGRRTIKSAKSWRIALMVCYLALAALAFAVIVAFPPNEHTSAKGSLAPVGPFFFLALAAGHWYMSGRDDVLATNVSLAQLQTAFESTRRPLRLSEPGAVSMDVRGGDHGGRTPPRYRVSFSFQDPSHRRKFVSAFMDELNSPAQSEVGPMTLDGQTRGT